jgi:polyisoprenoid-binding protein YceI
VNTTGTTTHLTRLTGTWKLDPRKTSVAFRTRAMWIFTVKGTARALSGYAVITPDGGAKGNLVIDAASFDTGNARRDDHLRTADFLAAAAHPAIVFEAATVRPGSAGLDVHGTLTVRGRTQPVTLHAEVSGSPDSATVTASIEIDRSRWGITWGAKIGISISNHITISAHFDRT